MREVERAGEAQVRHAVLRPRRAAVLAGLSRLVLAAAVLGVAWSFTEVRSALSAPPRPAAGPVTDVTAQRGGNEHARTYAERLDVIHTVASDLGARLQRVELRRGAGSVVLIELLLEAPEGRASDVEHIVTSLAMAGLDDVALRSITPTVAGYRLDIGASSTVTTHRLRSSALDTTRPIGVVLSEVVERTGTQLRRLSVPPSRVDAVRMEVSGPADAVLDAIAIIEREVSAPMRFESIRAQNLLEGAWDVGLAFHPRTTPTIPVP